MLFKIQPLLFSIIFAMALELVTHKEGLFFNVAIFLVAFSIFAVWPLARKVRFLAIPFFLSLGAFSMLYLIDQQIEKHIFIFISAVVYYLALLGAYRLKFYDCDQTAQGMINVATISTIFYWYVSNYGWFLNFQIATWFLILTFIGSTFLITLPSLRICAAMQLRKKREIEKRAVLGNGGNNYLAILSKGNKELKKKIPTYILINHWVILFLNLIVSLVMAQVIWALSLWPFGYLTTGVIAVIIYFVFWDIVRNFIQGSLERNAVLINIFLAALSIAGILFTTRWELTV